MIRSLLFVPADSERKLAKSVSLAADALVIDLEDAVLPERKSVARQMVQSWMREQSDHSRLWIRVNDLHSGELLKDLVAVVPTRPTGIMLPKIHAPADVAIVGHYLDALEAAHDLEQGSIRINALVTETPSLLLRLGELVDQAHPRITHVSWGGEDLSSALGAGDPRMPDGSWRPLYESARNQCLLAGHALGAEVIDTVYVDFRDADGLRESCRQARYDGFTGRVAIHPSQVDIINASFSPTEAELELARRVVDAFKSGAGAVAIDGKMYDLPHLRAARRLLASAT